MSCRLLTHMGVMARSCSSDILLVLFPTVTTILFLAFFFFSSVEWTKRSGGLSCAACHPQSTGSVCGWCVLRPSSLPCRCCDYWCTAHRLHAAISPAARLWGAVLGQKGLGSTVVAEGKQLGACGVGCWWSHPCQRPLCFSNGC